MPNFGNSRPAVDGLLVIDKPLGLSSRSALDRAWRWLPRGTRVGHTGTLDPLATGVLVVCAGAATRLAEYVQRMEKVYQAGIRLGMVSTTDDGEGQLTPVPGASHRDRDQVKETLRAFLGTIEQVPPDHSAAKSTGRRAYALARRGKQVTLAARPVSIHAVDIQEYHYPRLDIEVRCGKGTYIRSLARDIGNRLGCGAYLESLRRLRVGHFHVRDALPLDADRQTALARLLPLVEAVRGLRQLALPPDMVLRLQQGQGVAWAELGLATGLSEGEEIAVVAPDGELLAVGQVDQDLIMPRKVFV
jgi:tRNA pseudouridine55 synthase